MKVKRFVCIPDAQDFLRNPETGRLALTDYEGMTDWTYCGELEFEINVDTAKLVETAKAEIDTEIGKHTAMINVLETRKAELLAIGYDGDGSS